MYIGSSWQAQGWQYSHGMEGVPAASNQPENHNTAICTCATVHTPGTYLKLSPSAHSMFCTAKSPEASSLDKAARVLRIFPASEWNLFFSASRFFLSKSYPGDVCAYEE